MDVSVDAFMCTCAHACIHLEVSKISKRHPSLSMRGECTGARMNASASCCRSATEGGQKRLFIPSCDLEMFLTGLI
jgi:hypothetical protein